jgi:hypothetical protein
MTELGMLRTRLRAVNMEYSALRKRRRWAGALGRMAALRAERQALMALIAAHARDAPKARWSSRAREGAAGSRCASSTALSPG